MGEDVSLEHVSMVFEKFRAVNDVSVTIKAGEFFSFLGPSGCGKTTILRMISGFIAPTRGNILIGGKNMAGIKPNERPTALIFQNLALFPLMTVWENIAFGLEMRKVSKQARRKRADELLALVELPDAADKKISQLSGGQKQRVAIARALAVEPQVMLLDEPLSALDLKLRQHMRAELRAIQKRTGVTFIYITHDQGEALAMSDRVGVMSKGVLQQVATPEIIYNQPVNSIVASFVGENNIIPGLVKDVQGEVALFETEHGSFETRLGRGLKKGDAANLYIRPEHTKIASAEKDKNIISGTVREVSFEGNFTTVIMQDSLGKTLSAQIKNIPGQALCQPGESLKLAFEGAHALVLAPSSSPEK